MRSNAAWDKASARARTPKPAAAALSERNRNAQTVSSSATVVAGARPFNASVTASTPKRTRLKAERDASRTVRGKAGYVPSTMLHFAAGGSPKVATSLTPSAQPTSPRGDASGRASASIPRVERRVMRGTPPRRRHSSPHHSPRRGGARTDPHREFDAQFLAADVGAIAEAAHRVVVRLPWQNLEGLVESESGGAAPDRKGRSHGKFDLNLKMGVGSMPVVAIPLDDAHRGWEGALRRRYRSVLTPPLPVEDPAVCPEGWAAALENRLELAGHHAARSARVRVPPALPPVDLDEIRRWWTPRRQHRHYLLRDMVASNGGIAAFAEMAGSGAAVDPRFFASSPGGRKKWDRFREELAKDPLGAISRFRMKLSSRQEAGAEGDGSDLSDELDEEAEQFLVQRAQLAATVEVERQFQREALLAEARRRIKHCPPESNGTTPPSSTIPPLPTDLGQPAILATNDATSMASFSVPPEYGRRNVDPTIAGGRPSHHDDHAGHAVGSGVSPLSGLVASTFRELYYNTRVKHLNGDPSRGGKVLTAFSAATLSASRTSEEQ